MNGDLGLFKKYLSLTGLYSFDNSGQTVTHYFRQKAESSAGQSGIAPDIANNQLVEKEINQTAEKPSDSRNPHYG